MDRSVKRENVFFRHRTAFFLFAFVTLYHFIVVNWMQLRGITNVTYSYHIVDYSLGFCTKLLPGAVFRGLFGDKGTPAVATVYEMTLFLLFLLAASFFLEALILRTEKKDRSLMLILCLFYLGGPFTFSIFSHELGMLDVYWLFFAAAFFYLLNRKYAICLVPLLFLLSILVHFSSILCYIVLFAVLLLYKASLQEGKSKKTTLAVFVVSIVLSAATFLYFLIFEKSNLHYSMEELDGFILNRGGIYTDYYDLSFFSFYGDEYVIPDAAALAEYAPIVRLLTMIAYRFKYIIGLYRPDLIYNLVFDLVLITPFLVVFFGVLRKHMRRSVGNALKRVSIFFMFVQFPFTLFFGCLSSADVNRWVTHAFLVLFSMILTLCYYEKNVRWDLLHIIGSCKTHAAFYLYSLTYFIVSFWAYC